MTQEIVMVDQTYMPAMSIPQAVQRFNTLVEFVQTVMRDGVDYGIVPGTNKPTLLKAGAEKLTTLFGLTTRFNLVEHDQDWSGDSHGGEPFFYYWYRCSLWRGERMIAEADGSCNSRESKYRWRWVNLSDIPSGLNAAQLTKRGGTISEFTFAVDKAETGGKYGKPAEYWQAFQSAIEAKSARLIKRKAQSGKEMDAWEIDSTMYRVPNEDIASQVNTVQKMAQKRAFVAVTLIGVNASEFFTQDVEDMDLIGSGGSYIPPVSPAETKAPETISPPATNKQRGYIAGLLDDLGWYSEHMAQFAKEHNIDLADMTMADASYLIEQMRAALDEPAKVAKELKKPSPSTGDLQRLADSVWRLRDMERTATSEPPEFTWNKKQGREPLENEYIDSRMRLYAWLTAKIDAAPALEELDDKSLMDLAYAAAGL